MERLKCSSSVWYWGLKKKKQSEKCLFFLYFLFVFNFLLPSLLILVTFYHNNHRLVADFPIIQITFFILLFTLHYFFILFIFLSF